MNTDISFDLGKLHQTLVERKALLYVVATGAGAGIQELLWKRPGASGFLVGGSFPYDRQATEEFLGFKPEKSVNRKTAIQLAQEAYMRAYRADPDPRRDVIGLALTAAVQTSRERKGEDRAELAIVCNLGLFRGGFVLHRIVKPSDHDVPIDRLAQGRWCDEQALKFVWDLYQMLESSKWDSQVSNDEAADIIYENPVFKPGGLRGKTRPGNMFFPGTFNPLHDGHRGVIEAALDSTHHRAAYTMTSTSIHKGSALTPVQILQRASQFRNEPFPFLLTRNDALFLQKARQFPGATFVMGVDTLERVLEAKWFAGQIPELESLPPEVAIKEMLREFDDLGIRFKVLDRRTASTGDMSTLDDVLGKHGYFHQHLFERVARYWNISSTQIRNARGW